MHGTDHKNQGYDQKNQTGVLVFVAVEPVVVHILCQITHRQHFPIHPIHCFLAELPLHLHRPHKVVTDRQGVGLVILLYRQGGFLLLYAAYARKFHLAVPYFDTHIFHVPQVHLILH